VHFQGALTARAVLDVAEQFDAFGEAEGLLRVSVGERKAPKCKEEAEEEAGEGSHGRDPCDSGSAADDLRGSVVFRKVAHRKDNPE
jgi:hypothetical protein